MLLAGCGYHWDLPEGAIDTGCTTAPFFVDADGDGWGDPSSTAQMLCQGDEELQYTARNARDCDDADKLVTGRVGSICPDSLVSGGTSYAGDIYGGSEFVIVHADTALVWPAYADDACSPWGWGGALATFGGQDDLDTVKAAVADLPVWAGYVGVIPDGAGGWAWADGSGLDLDAIGPCDAEFPDSTDVDDARQWLALVKRGDNDWCLGTPDAALDFVEDAASAPAYGADDGHFVCERAIPDAAAYDVDAEDLAAAE